MSRREVQNEEVLERFGPYEYFLKAQPLPQKTKAQLTLAGEAANTEQGYYDAFFRKPVEGAELQEAECVIDLLEVPSVRKHDLHHSAVEKVKISDDHKFVAFTYSNSQNEVLKGGVKDISNQRVLDCKFDRVSQIEFSEQNSIIFVVRVDEMNRPFQVCLHDLAIGSEKVIFEDSDPTHYVDITATKDQKYLVINNNTKEDSEIWVLERDGTQTEPVKLFSREKDAKTYVDHLRDFFVVITNREQEHQNFKIATLRDAIYKEGKDTICDCSQWRDLKIQDDDSGLQVSEFDGFEDFMVIYSKDMAKPKVHIYDFKTDEVKDITTGEFGEIHPGLNQDYSSSSCSFSYTNPFTYNQIWRYDHHSGKHKMEKNERLQGGQRINPADYEQRLEMVPSADGEEVPMMIMHKKGASRRRKNKTLIEAYGCYGLNMTQQFDIMNLSAMEQGWVIAHPYVRGGGEKGVAWHQKGKLANKTNSIQDFIACTEFLVAEGLSHPNYIAAKGISAGATLAASAALNLRPELFRAVILNVPFLDVLTTLLEEELPLTATDRLEFGNPEKSLEMYNLIKGISPYDNLSHKEYPSVLINMNLHDQRVPSWSVLKFVEKLRHLSKAPQEFPDFGDKNIVCNINQQGGHFGSNDNAENLSQAIWEYAWLDFVMFKKDNAKINV